MHKKVRDRLEYIEYSLLWKGMFSRRRLISRFEISVPQATKDIRKYKEIAPNNLMYDRSSRRYSIGMMFKPVLLSDSMEKTLFTMYEEGALVTNPNVVPHIAKERLITITRAIENKSKLDIGRNLFLLNGVIIPTNLFKDSDQALYMRCFSENTNKYLTLHIGDLYKCETLDKYPHNLKQDLEWETMLTVKYKIDEVIIQREVRAALVNSFLLDCEATASCEVLNKRQLIAKQEILELIVEKKFSNAT